MPTMTETKALEFAYPAEEGAEPVLALRGVDTAIEKGSFVVVLGHNGSGKSTFAKMPERHFAALRRQGVCGGHGHAGRGVPAGDSPPGGHGVPEPGQPDRCQRGGGGCGLRPGESGSARGGDPPPGGRRAGGCGYDRLHDAMRPICSPADRSSGWPLPASSPWSRSASCWTRPPPCWTPSDGRRCCPTIHKLNREKGITVVLITHHMNEAEEADRVVVMDDGKIVAGRHAEGGLYAGGGAADHGPDGAGHGGLAGPSAEGRAGRTAGRFDGGRMCPGCRSAARLPAGETN